MFSTRLKRMRRRPIFFTKAFVNVPKWQAVCDLVQVFDPHQKWSRPRGGSRHGSTGPAKTATPCRDMRVSEGKGASPPHIPDPDSDLSEHIRLWSLLLDASPANHSSSLSSIVIIASVAITLVVMLIQVVAETLVGVIIQDVSKGEGVSQLSSMGEVLAVVSTLGPIHHQGVGANVGSVSTFSIPIGRG